MNQLSEGYGLETGAERWTVGVAAAFMIAACLLAADDRFLFRLVSSIHLSPPIAELAQSSKDVRRRLSDELTWLSIRTGEEVYQADHIFTGERSEAYIHFKDGIQVTIDPQSLVIVSMKEGRPLLQVEGGSVWIKFSANPAKIWINHGQRDVQISGQGAEVMLNAHKGGRTETSVLTGQVRVEADHAKSIELTKNQVLEIPTEASAPSVLRDFPVDLLSPASHEKIAVTREREKTFSWSPVPGAKSYEVEFSADPLFQTLHRQGAEGTSLKLDQPIEPGPVFWRVRAVMKDLAKKPESMSYRFVVTPEQRFSPIFPAPKEILDLPRQVGTGQAPATRPLYLRWDDTSARTHYQIELASDPTFSHVLVSQETSATDCEAGALQAGSYFWRVRETGANWSETFDFKLVESEIKGPPEALTPEDAAVILTGEQNDAQVQFRWKERENSQDYLLEISRSADFSPKYLELRQETNSLITLRQLKSSQNYYWRVMAKTRNGAATEFSPVRSLVLRKTEPAPPALVPSLLAPEVDKNPMDYELHSLNFNASRPALFSRLEVFFLRSAYAGASVVGPKLKWKPVQGADHYLLEVSTHRDFAATVLKQHVHSPFFTWNHAAPGIFYWRVHALDAKNTIGPASEIVRLRVHVPPPSELSERVIPTTPEALPLVELGWKKSPQTEAYRVTVSDQADFKAHTQTFVTHSTVERVPASESGKSLYWRVEPLGGNETSIGAPSATQNFLIPTPITFATVETPNEHTRWPGFHPKAALGLSAVAYSETLTPNYNAVELVLSGGGVTQFTGSRWNLSLDGNLGLMASGSGVAGQQLKYLEGFGALGYSSGLLPAPWRLGLHTGWFYTTTEVGDSSFGFKNMMGPELYPSLEYGLSNGSHLYVSYKILPDLTGGFSNLFGNRQSRAAFGWVSTETRVDPVHLQGSYFLEAQALWLQARFQDVITVASNSWTLNFGWIW